MKITSCIILLLTCFFFASKADNKIRIIQDTTNQYAIFEMSRNNPSSYKISFADEKGNVLYKTVESITAVPKLISIPWKDFKPGFYHLTAKNRKETVRLLFIKK